MDSFDGKAKHRQESQFNVYTDGSKLNDQTGAGVAIYKGGSEIASDCYRLPNGTTVFQAEITAIAKAAEMLTGLQDGRVKYVKIFVDSQAAIRAVGNAKVNSRAVAQAIDNLNRLAGCTVSVTLVWIPAHKGHLGNERADVLAKEGSKTSITEKRVYVGQPQATVKFRIKECTSKTGRRNGPQ